MRAPVTMSPLAVVIAAVIDKLRSRTCLWMKSQQKS